MNKMAEQLGKLAGLPLDQVEEILQSEGLAVEGTHANGVDHVSVTEYSAGVPGEAKDIKVKSMVVWDATGQPTTLYVPSA